MRSSVTSYSSASLPLAWARGAPGARAHHAPRGPPVPQRLLAVGLGARRPGQVGPDLAQEREQVAHEEVAKLRGELDVVDGPPRLDVGKGQAGQRAAQERFR